MTGRSWRLGGISKTAMGAGLVFAVAIGWSAGVTAAVTSSPQLATAKKALLVHSDMPTGWTSSKTSNNNSHIPGSAQLASCLGVPTSVITSSPPTAYSPQFASSNQQFQVEDSVSIYPSAKAARNDYASLANPKAPACLATILNGPAKASLSAGSGPGTSIGTISVTRTPATDYAPHSATFTAFLPLTENEQVINVQLTVVDYVKGNKEQTVTLTSVQTQFPTSLAQRLTAVAVGRL
jgi:hypothetical protein